MRGKDLLRRGSIPLEERYYGNARIFREDAARGFLRTLRPAAARTRRHRARSTRAARELDDPIARMQYVDLFTWLRGDILVKADKMTMANSLELRVPFLDTEVFEVAGDAARSDQKVTKETTKSRCAGRWSGSCPPHVLHRRKLGFPVPIRHWLRRRDVRVGARHHHATRRPTYLSTRRPCWRCWTRTAAGEADHSRRIWTVLVFCSGTRSSSSAVRPRSRSRSTRYARPAGST